VPSSPHALSTASCALEIQVCCFCSLPLSIRYMKVWVYPSQQMFYNAMRRKGWTPSEDDMAAVVAIHNAGASVSGLAAAWQCRGGPAHCQLTAQEPAIRLAIAEHSTSNFAAHAAVVAVAGAVNERAWREIQRWEEVQAGTDSSIRPRLVKFR
jgi:hypothetical protein